MDRRYRPFKHRWAVYVDSAKYFFREDQRDVAEQFAIEQERRLWAIRPSLVNGEEAIHFSPVTLNSR